MNSLQKLSAVTLFLFFSTAAFAQQKPAKTPAIAGKQEDVQEVVWKKELTREIDLGDKGAIKDNHISDVSSENSLIEVFVNLIKSNKIPAYTNSEHRFTQRLSVGELNKLMAGKKDTVQTIDPVTGKTVNKITTKEFSLDSVHKYRILEEWSSYPYSGKTEIQVIGIAPLKNTYNDDGSYHGATPMFWLRFSEVSAVLVRYQQYHPNNTLAGHIWEDYFK